MRSRLTAAVLLCAFLLGVFVVLPPVVRGVSSTVVISEFRVRGPNGGSDEFIELYNLSSSPVNIGGWWLSDSANDLFKYRIPTGLLVPGAGFAVFTDQQFGGGPNGFNLSAAGDDVWLVVADASDKPLRFADNVAFDATLTGVSLGRVPDGQIAAELFPLASRSLGSANGGHLAGDVILSEVHYHPADPPPPAGTSTQ